MDINDIEISYWQDTHGNAIYREKAKTSLQERGVIGFVHGLGEHIGRYHILFDFFLKQGFSVFGFDSYGHGKSEGKRGHIESLQQWISEIEMLLTWMNQESDSPKILYGHSLGGLKTLAYLLKGKVLPSKAVVTSPFIEQGTPEPALKVATGKVLSYIFPKFSISNGLKVEGISRDEEQVEFYKKDKWNHDRVSLKMARIMFDTAKNVSNSYQISIPLLLFHGTDDILTSCKATEAFSKSWQGDITFKSWQGGYHELHHEPNKEQILEKIVSWLNIYKS